MVFKFNQTALSTPFDNTDNEFVSENVQEAVEEHGKHIIGERPSGVKNGINLVYTTAFEFLPGTLEVFLSGVYLEGYGIELDFSENLGYAGFTIILDPTKSWRLNKAPLQNETLLVNYRKRIPQP